MFFDQRLHCLQQAVWSHLTEPTQFWYAFDYADELTSPQRSLQQTNFW